MRAFLHLGAHKTATSYLQAQLRASPRLFEANGSVLVGRPDMPDSAWQELLDWQRSPELPVPTSYVDFLQAVRESGTESFLMSFEGLIGRVSLALDGTIYPMSDRTIGSLADAYGDLPVKVGFAVRNYASFIESTYSELVNGALTTRTFDNYLKKVDLEGLSWRRVVSQLRDAFGQENVFVWSYESYTEEPSAFTRRVVEFYFGADAGNMLEDISDTRVRSSTGATALELQRRINVAVRRHVTNKDRWRPALLEANDAVRDTFSGIDDPPLRIQSELRPPLDERYRRDCDRLGIELPERWPDR